MVVKFRANNFMFNCCVADSMLFDWAQNYRGMMFGLFHKPVRDPEELPKEPFFVALRAA